MGNKAYANKGMALETTIEYLNNQYKAAGRAVIHKVPTEWKPLRQGGRIASAKVVRKAAVDFLGAYRGRPLAFDAKDCSKDRISFAVVEQHQAEFLDDWMLQNPGGLSFILAGHLSADLYVVPWIYWRDGMARRLRGGPASAHFQKDLECYRVRGHDYLAKVDELWGIFTGEEANKVEATLQDRLDNVRDLIDTQAGQLCKGEDLSYSLGLYNGMEMALSIIEGRDPSYKSKEVIGNGRDL